MGAEGGSAPPALKEWGQGGGKISLLILSTDKNFSHFLLLFVLLSGLTFYP